MEKYIEDCYTVYSENADMTFILKDTIDEISGKLKSKEVIGFYFGRPNETNSDSFIGKLKADFE